jgi:hypothetical protein
LQLKIKLTSEGSLWQPPNDHVITEHNYGRRVYPQGWKKEASTRALLAGNVKQLQEIRLNEDLLLKICRKP